HPVAVQHLAEQRRIPVRPELRAAPGSEFQVEEKVPQLIVLTCLSQMDRQVLQRIASGVAVEGAPSGCVLRPAAAGGGQLCRALLPQKCAECLVKDAVLAVLFHQELTGADSVSPARGRQLECQ